MQGEEDKFKEEKTLNFILRVICSLENIRGTRIQIPWKQELIYLSSGPIVFAVVTLASSTEVGAQWIFNS